MLFKAIKKAMKVATKKFDKLEIVIEVPQVESVEDATTFLGGNDGLLNFVNSALEAGAKNTARAAGADAGEDKTKDEVISLVEKAGKGYSPNTSSAMSKAEMADTIASLKALVSKGDYSREDIEALLKASK